MIAAQMLAAHNAAMECYRRANRRRATASGDPVAVLKCAALLAYLNAYATVAEAKAGIGCWLDFYNAERQHQSLGYRTPRQIYQQGLWIYGRSALPTGCASPASRASPESGEMLAFAHIPTGTTTNNRIDIDEVNGRFGEPASVTAIGADIETGRVTP